MKHAKKISWFLGAFLLVCLLYCAIGHYTLLQSGYYPADDVLGQLQYEKLSGGGGYQSKSGIQKVITLDLENEKASKNGYAFDIAGQWHRFLGRTYLGENMVEEMLQVQVAPGLLTTKVTPIEYSPHQWLTAFPNLIAHAGGTFRGQSYNTFYTNSLEAIEQNYSLGHRVFEIDFSLTSDGKLAAVHDWEQFGHANGVAMSSAEWLGFQTYGSPVTESRFTSMLIGDILDQMMVNEDLFIVTDTKIADDQAAIRQQFMEIYNEASKRDLSLLNRIIPQIYNEEMLAVIQDVYPFPSVIYTLYMTQDSAEKVLDFVLSQDSIQTVTIPVGHGVFFTQDFFEALHANGKKVYTHTIHTYDDLTTYSALGVDGFYTGLLLPRDQLLYRDSEKR